ncbi:MAG: S-adenosylmethionine:tRNA ribosyltransferase-isomerase [Tannerellaceae bacterium]|jgi:S-adenosylmethionine:tRNA ribosyltransferase-isomerase|nr:S-adenosylmethionine:tRNA ribosyltransferase-isomerase [Tannerellaceae bacterium]
MITKTQHIRIDAYDYRLPDERIAKYPLQQRDESKLLIYRDGEIAEDSFSNIVGHLPGKSLLVFNNTRVIQARIMFPKDTGALIEIFCLEPAEPSDYALAFSQSECCVWHCLVGNLRKWKEGTLRRSVDINGRRAMLEAHRLSDDGDVQHVRFVWDEPAFTFAEILDGVGLLPIPPYLHRDTEAADLETYQTVYSSVKGSVASPTAGLHFTPAVFDSLDAAGFCREEVTLHVGAGTFKPVQHNTIGEHVMHTEYISVGRSSIERIRDRGPVIAVGTTSARTLESLYWAGVILENRPDATAGELAVPQWMPYAGDGRLVTAGRALQNVLGYLDGQHLDRLVTSTRIMIAPGYTFKIVEGMITNFHQPRSTLLLLIDAFTRDWERIYGYAMEHDFRFLSYGDSSLLLRDQGNRTKIIY